MPSPGIFDWRLDDEDHDFDVVPYSNRKFSWLHHDKLLVHQALTGRSAWTTKVFAIARFPVANVSLIAESHPKQLSGRAQPRRARVTGPQNTIPINAVPAQAELEGATRYPGRARTLVPPPTR